MRRSVEECDDGEGGGEEESFLGGRHVEEEEDVLGSGGWGGGDERGGGEGSGGEGVVAEGEGGGKGLESGEGCHVFGEERVVAACEELVSELREREDERRTCDDEAKILVLVTNAREGIDSESDVLLAFETVDREERRLFAARSKGSVSFLAAEWRATNLTSQASCFVTSTLPPYAVTSTAGYTTRGNLPIAKNVFANTCAVNSELTKILSASPVVAASITSIGILYILRICPPSEMRETGPPVWASACPGERRRSGKWQ